MEWALLFASIAAVAAALFAAFLVAGLVWMLGREVRALWERWREGR